MRTLLALCGAAAALALMPETASAACANAGALVQAAYPKAVRSGDGFNVRGAYLQHITTSAVACKASPTDPSVTLAAIPLIEAAPKDEDVKRGDIEVIAAETANGRPIARLLERGMANSDAVYLEGVALDTARYDIKDGVRAFGVRLEMSGSSRVNPFSETSLWLYSFEGGHLARVLSGLVVEQQNGEENGPCNGSSKTVERVVSMGPGGPEGVRDLVIGQTVNKEELEKSGADCKTNKGSARLQDVVLHFGAGHYATPPGSDEPSQSNDFQPLFTSIKIEAPVEGRPAATPAAGPGAPSFDCGKAGTPAEKAICGDKRLSALDADIARDYKRLQAALAPAAAALLGRDQKDFVAMRDQVVRFNASTAVASLQEYMKQRASFLALARPPADDGFQGLWGNVTGAVVVEANPDGSVHVGIDTNEPGLARWVCSGALDGRIANGMLRIPQDDGSTVELTRDGQTLKIQTTPPPGKKDWQSDDCGRNGSIEGNYFAEAKSK